LLEELNAYTDSTRSDLVFKINADTLFELEGVYTVREATRKGFIGRLKKIFVRSLHRSTWEIWDHHNRPIGHAQEKSALVAFLRRFLQVVRFVPYVGDFFFVAIPYHFDFFVGEKRVGQLTRVLHWRDVYLLDLTADKERVLERRLAVAAAICMDAMQSR
jgi:hypothetical protein